MRLRMSGGFSYWKDLTVKNGSAIETLNSRPSYSIDDLFSPFGSDLASCYASRRTSCDPRILFQCAMLGFLERPEMCYGTG